jgi:hypothetical protein
MTVKGEATMSRDDAKPRSLAALIAWPILIVLLSAGLLGGFAGYSQARVDDGGAPLPAWAGPLAALIFGALALAVYVRRYGSAWQSLSPRRRRYWLALGFCAVIGGVIGGGLAAGQPEDRGFTEMLASGSLSPGFAVGASLLWIGGLAAGMTLYHRAIDDHEERAWLWACVAGWYAFIFPAPAWWALHRAGLAPPVDAMLLFFLSLVVNALVWAWLKFR